MDTKTFFDSLSMFGIKPGLEATEALMRRAGNPARDLKFIHIAGTNGKGSTGAMLECALRKAGLNTGFYTSPHLVDIRERFRVNGRAVSSADFDAYVAELADVVNRPGEEKLSYTYFEFTTVLAALIFARAGVDVVIWETGMGGRLDATNVVTPVASVITNIALDHQSYLGNTLEKIAAEKAGIIKPGVPLFYGEMPAEAREVLVRRARSLGAAPTGPGEAIDAQVRYTLTDDTAMQEFSYRGRQICLPLLGAMQRRNFRIVIQVLSALAPKLGFDLDRALDGLTAVRWPARCQRLNSRLFVDGGHNPDGLAALREAMREILPGETFTIVFAGFKDKDVSGSLHLILPLAAEFIFVPLHEPGRPCCSAAEMSAMIADSGVPCRAADNALLAINDALRDSRRKVLAAGSLYLAGEVLAAFADPREVLDLV